MVASHAESLPSEHRHASLPGLVLGEEPPAETTHRQATRALALGTADTFGPRSPPGTASECHCHLCREQQAGGADALFRRDERHGASMCLLLVHL